jgi:ankyrin repeat protein
MVNELLKGNSEGETADINAQDEDGYTPFDISEMW